MPSMMDYAPLLGAKGIELPTSLDYGTQAARLGLMATQNQMGQLDLQQQQAMIAAMQNPAVMQALTQGSMNLSPDQMQQYGPGLPKLLPLMLGMQQKQAETTKNLAEADKFHSDVVNQTIGRVTNTLSMIPDAQVTPQIVARAMQTLANVGLPLDQFGIGRDDVVNNPAAARQTLMQQLMNPKDMQDIIDKAHADWVAGVERKQEQAKMGKTEVMQTPSGPQPYQPTKAPNIPPEPPVGGLPWLQQAQQTPPQGGGPQALPGPQGAPQPSAPTQPVIPPSGGEQEAKIDADADQALRLRSRIGEMRTLLAQFSPNAAAPIRQRVAEIAQSMGASKDLVTGIAGGDLAAMQQFLKQSTQTAFEAAHDQMQGVPRAAMEIAAQINANPSAKLLPEANAKMLDFMDLTARYRLMRQQEKEQWLRPGADTGLQPHQNLLGFDAQFNSSNPMALIAQKQMEENALRAELARRNLSTGR